MAAILFAQIVIADLFEVVELEECIGCKAPASVVAGNVGPSAYCADCNAHERVHGVWPHLPRTSLVRLPEPGASCPL